MPVLKITLPIFSGRRNPTLLVTGKKAAQLMKEIDKLNASGLADPTNYAGLLGYDGFKIEGHPDVPQIHLHSSLQGPASQALEERLLDTIKPKLGRLFGVSTARIISSHVLEEIPLGPSRNILLPHEDADAGYQPNHPTWLPAYWNGSHRGSNNCYAYSTNHRTDTFPQPGLGSGHMYEGISTAEVLPAALRDGLKKVGDGSKFQLHVGKGWVVVLVIWPDVDYHWYRVDFDAPADRPCSHKPGGTPARQTDNSGKFITNPYEADRGGYTEVAATLLVEDYNGLKIA